MDGGLSSEFLLLHATYGRQAEEQFDEHHHEQSGGCACWVDAFQPDPEAATQFYGPLQGWTFDDPIAMPDGLTGE